MSNRWPNEKAISKVENAAAGENEISSQPWEDLDRVMLAMLETGRALPALFKEMGTAGLGVTMVNC